MIELLDGVVLFGFDFIGIDLVSSIKAGLKWYISFYLDAIEQGNSLVLRLYAAVMKATLKLDTAQLQDLNGVYHLSRTIFFLFLTILALYQLLFVQLFPRSSRADPYRFGERAFVAVLLIVLVNPPGSGTLFANGLFAWAFELTNLMQNYYLTGIGSLDVALKTGTPTRSLTSLFRMVLTNGIVTILLVVSLLAGQVVLVLRQYILYVVYGLFPLLVGLWIVDVGPLKYGNQIAKFAFQLAVVVLVAGILIAGVLNASLTMLADGSVGGAAAAPVETVGSEPSGVVRGGVLASDSTTVEEMMAEVVFLSVAGLGVFGVFGVAIIKAIGMIGGNVPGSGGEERPEPAETRGRAAARSRATRVEGRESGRGESGREDGGDGGVGDALDRGRKSRNRLRNVSSESLQALVNPGFRSAGEFVSGRRSDHQEIIRQVDFERTQMRPKQGDFQKPTIEETEHLALKERELARVESEIAKLDSEDRDGIDCDGKSQIGHVGR